MTPVETRSDIRSRLVAASAADVFAALSDPARVARWWGAGQDHPSENHHFVLTISLVPQGAGTRVDWQQTFDTADDYEQLAGSLAQANAQVLVRLSGEALRGS